MSSFINKDYNSFFKSCNKVIYELNKTTSVLSDTVSADLKSRGMKFVGSTMIYSFLQAIGIINSHDEGCFKFHQNSITI